MLKLQRLKDRPEFSVWGTALSFSQEGTVHGTGLALLVVKCPRAVKVLPSCECKLKKYRGGFKYLFSKIKRGSGIKITPPGGKLQNYLYREGKVTNSSDGH
jgi:hypothetical protein